MGLAGMAVSHEGRRIEIRGAVQGVGFRPFLHRLAGETSITGSVRNLPGGVCVEAEGEPDRLDEFLARLSAEAPPGARVDGLAIAHRTPAGAQAFRILASTGAGHRGPVPLDVAPCGACVEELFDPASRRFGYAFLSCASCGPRYSILESLPYDRERTTMRLFPMCPACTSEYEDPTDRRFHAQTNACAECGPRLHLWDHRGGSLAGGDRALQGAVDALREGATVAVKGLGGFQLLVRADGPRAVGRLRARKGRPDKPLALQVRDLSVARSLCTLSPKEERALASREAPIVLARRRRDQGLPIADAVAPGCSDLGLLLPATPLHHLLARRLGVPLVATSGNRSGEPILTVDEEARVGLAGVADVYLVHDRPIAHAVDDSIVRESAGRIRVLRAGRGYAPLSIRAPGVAPGVVARGSFLKNTTCVGDADQLWVSPHVGDLGSRASTERAAQGTSWLATLGGGCVRTVATDLHPEAARGEASATSVEVQHHYAHVLACLAEQGEERPVLGIVWDGTGYGLDGTIWGGEFLRADPAGFERLGHLRRFALPGGERAVREGRRAALGILYELRGRAGLHDVGHAPVRSFSPSERRLLGQALDAQLRCPTTSSMGRLFDAVASLCGLRQISTFEGQAAMALEGLAGGVTDPVPYPFPLCTRGLSFEADWGPLVRAVCEDVRRGVDVPRIAAGFHASLVAVAVAAAEQVAIPRVVLSGGCFQNRLLLDALVPELRAAGFDVLVPERVPPNDGGIALGQAFHAARAVRAEEE